MAEPRTGAAPPQERVPTAVDALGLPNSRYFWSANFLYFSALQVQVAAMQWLLLEGQQVQRVLMRMTSSTRLEMEVQPGSCGATWAINRRTIYER